MAGLGWLGITSPEEYGGTGGSFLDLYPDLRGDGALVLVPSPHLDTVVVAGGATPRRVAPTTQKRRVLPAIADGSCIVSTAVIEGDGSFGPGGIACSASVSGGDYVLNGTKLLVGYAPSADYFLVAARTGNGASAEGISLFLVDAHANGISWARDAQHRWERAVRGHVRRGGDARRQRRGGGRRRLGGVVGGCDPKAAVLQTATIVGAARAVLEMTNQYAKDREQFGSPIGRYQAVQYMVSDILIDLHRADLLAKQAAFRISVGKPSTREAAIAVAFGKKAAAHLHRQAHEVHAGVGVHRRPRPHALLAPGQVLGEQPR